MSLMNERKASERTCRCQVVLNTLHGLNPESNSVSDVYFIGVRPERGRQAK